MKKVLCGIWMVLLCGIYINMKLKNLEKWLTKHNLSKGKANECTFDCYVEYDYWSDENHSSAFMKVLDSTIIFPNNYNTDLGNLTYKELEKQLEKWK